MSLLVDLAERAISARDQAHDHLRTLTLSNLAAGLGDRGAADRLIRSLPFDPVQRPQDAAFVHAMALHARTQDDFFPTGRIHVGALTLAAALALADDTGDRLLECLAGGYEVMCTLSDAYSTQAQARGYRPSGVFGPLGAAATASLALGLDTSGLANAMGLASTMSAGTNQSWIAGTDEWLLEVGAAARAGVEAALFARAGAVAADLALEGAAGWARAFFGDDQATQLREKIAQGRSLIEAVAYKPYPVSGIAEVPTHLACLAHERMGDQTADEVVIRISEQETRYPGSMNRGPFRSRSAALMSVTLCVACGLADGVIRLARLENPNTPDLETLLHRIQLQPDPTIGEGEARLSVRLNGELVELMGSGKSLLYPSWSALSGAVHELAVRSEAREDQVAAVRDELSESSPGAPRLCRILAQCIGA